jgi:hypothetical protein
LNRYSFLNVNLTNKNARLLALLDAIPTPRRLDLLSPSNGQHQKNWAIQQSWTNSEGTLHFESVQK